MYENWERSIDNLCLSENSKASNYIRQKETSLTWRRILQKPLIRNLGLGLLISYL